MTNLHVCFAEKRKSLNKPICDFFALELLPVLERWKHILREYWEKESKYSSTNEINPFPPEIREILSKVKCKNCKSFDTMKKDDEKFVCISCGWFRFLFRSVVDFHSHYPRSGQSRSVENLKKSRTDYFAKKLEGETSQDTSEVLIDFRLFLDVFHKIYNDFKLLPKYDFLIRKLFEKNGIQSEKPSSIKYSKEKKEVEDREIWERCAEELAKFRYNWSKETNIRIKMTTSSEYFVKEFLRLSAHFLRMTDHLSFQDRTNKGLRMILELQQLYFNTEYPNEIPILMTTVADGMILEENKPKKGGLKNSSNEKMIKIAKAVAKAEKEEDHYHCPTCSESEGEDESESKRETLQEIKERVEKRLSDDPTRSDGFDSDEDVCDLETGLVTEKRKAKSKPKLKVKKKVEEIGSEPKKKTNKERKTKKDYLKKVEKLTISELKGLLSKFGVDHSYGEKKRVYVSLVMDNLPLEKVFT